MGGEKLALGVTSSESYINKALGSLKIFENTTQSFSLYFCSALFFILGQCFSAIKFNLPYTSCPCLLVWVCVLSEKNLESLYLKEK
jgi:hypothetical protein